MPFSVVLRPAPQHYALPRWILPNQHSFPSCQQVSTTNPCRCFPVELMSFNNPLKSTTQASVNCGQPTFKSLSIPPGFLMRTQHSALDRCVVSETESQQCRPSNCLKQQNVGIGASCSKDGCVSSLEAILAVTEIFVLSCNILGHTEPPPQSALEHFLHIQQGPVPRLPVRGCLDASSHPTSQPQSHCRCKAFLGADASMALYSSKSPPSLQPPPVTFHTHPPIRNAFIRVCVPS